MKSRKAAAVALVVLAAGGYAVMLAANISFAAGGADSSGYMNLARMLSRGQTRVVIEPLRTLGLDHSFIPLFTPIGFTWGIAGSGTMAPGYPPGLPLHLALAGALFGWEIGPFLISPLAALGCAALMFGTGRELGLSRPLALTGAAALVVLPHLISHAVQPVSDVVATFWSLAAVWLALVARARPRLAFAAGAAFAVGVWVRPTNVLLAVPIAVALRFHLGLLLRFTAGGLPFAAALLLYQNATYGGPWKTGYGTVMDVVSAQHFDASSRVLSRWMVQLCGPLIFPAGLLVLFDGRVQRWTRALLLAWFAVLFLFYCFWGPFDVFWVGRFLLPGTPALIFGTLIVLRDLLETPWARRWRRLSVATAAALAMVMVAMPLRQLGPLEILGTDEAEAMYPDAVRFAEEHLPEDAIVISGALSGAFFYYSGRFTARLDQLDDERFQLLRAYAGNRSLKWYAVVVDGETHWDGLGSRLRGHWTPVARMRNVTLWRLES